MTEQFEFYQDPTSSLINWRSPQGADMANFIESLGILPSTSVPEKGMKRVFAYLGVAKEAAENHVELMNKIGKKEITLLQQNSLFKISARYRPSISGNTEGISTVEILLDSKPVFHARFMCFEFDKNPCFAITGLQRYTDEKLSPVTKSLHSDWKANPPLREVDPKRYKEYSQETGKIKKLEGMLETSFPSIAVATCAALAKAHGDSSFLLTKYDNQLWVKLHANDQQKTEIPDVYDPTAKFFGMSQSTEMPGFWEIEKTEGSLTYPENSPAHSNTAIAGVSEAAYQSLLELFR